MEAAGGAADAGGDGGGFEEAGGDESGGSCAEVEQRVGGLTAVDAALIAESDDRFGQSCPLLWGVDLLVDGGERVPAPVRVVVLDRFTQALEVGADQLGERDQQRVVHARQVHEPFPEMVQRGVGEAGEVGGCLSGELCDVDAGEVFFVGSALLSATAFGLAA